MRNESHKSKLFYRNKKLKCVEYKGGKCQVCEYNKCLAALDLHHLDPSQKDPSLINGGFNNRGIGKISMKSLYKELDKCILVCRNCHAEIHAGIVDSFQVPIPRTRDSDQLPLF